MKQVLFIFLFEMLIQNHSRLLNLYCATASRFTVISLGGWPVLAVIGSHFAFVWSLLIYKEVHLNEGADRPVPITGENAASKVAVFLQCVKKLSIPPLIALVSVFSYIHNKERLFHSDYYLAVRYQFSAVVH